MLVSGSSELAEPSMADSEGWGELVDQTRRGDRGAVAQLYRRFDGNFRAFLSSRVGPDETDDRLHDSFVITVEAIRCGHVRAPEKINSFFLTVLRRQLTAENHRGARYHRPDRRDDAEPQFSDPRPNPEERAAEAQTRGLVQLVLAELPPREREILTRFYLLEQSPEEICAEMMLSATQFRLLKSRAKARFARAGRCRLSRGGVDDRCLSSVKS